jgi:hypothetical protein
MHSMHSYFTRLSTIRRLCKGTLSEYIGHYATLLKECGYARASGQMQIYCVSSFSSWLDRRNIPPATIDEQTLQRYLAHRRRRKELQRGDAAALQRLLELLRRMECIRRRSRLGSAAVPVPLRISGAIYGRSVTCPRPR